MNETLAVVSDLFKNLTSRTSSASPSAVLWLGLASVLLSLVLAVYTFYPAILAVLQPTLEPCRAQVIIQGELSKTSTLSIVIPAYNEQDRLPQMLQAAVDYLSTSTTSSSSNKSTYQHQQQPNKALKALQCTSIEWIIVSDGSTDDTETVVGDFVTAWATKNARHKTTWTWKLLVLPRNSGKGAAVRTGMLHAIGSWRLMVDADGATDFGPGLEALAAASSNNTSSCDVVIGSRAHLQATTAAKTRSVIRQALMHAFHFLCVVLVGARDIQDTQCGFKLFRASAANKLFAHLHLRGWAFDTELIYMVKHCGMTIKEVSVPWHEVDGSKLHTTALNLALVAVTMLRDMVCVRLCYTLGLWSVRVRRSTVRKSPAERIRKRRKED